MRHFAQQLPIFGPQELIDEFVGFSESMKSKSIPALHWLSGGILLYQKLEKATDQRSLKTSQERISEYCSNCWSLKDLILVCNETCVVNWVLLEHTGLWSLIYAHPSWRRSICTCLPICSIALRGARGMMGIVDHSSEESASMAWQCCLLKEQAEGGVEDGNQ